MKRIMCLDKEGIWTSSAENDNASLRNFIENYADKNHIVQATPKEIVSKTKSALFINVDDFFIYGYLPNELTEEQKQQLNIFSEFSLDSFKYMEITKYGDKSMICTCDENISEALAEILTSYNKENNNLKQRKYI